MVAGRTLGALSPSRGGLLICLLSQEGRWPSLRGGESQDCRRPARREAWLRGPPCRRLPALVLGEEGSPWVFLKMKKGGFTWWLFPSLFAFIFQVRKAIGKGMWRTVLQLLRSSTQGPVSFVGVQTPVVHDGDLGQQRWSPL